MTVRRLFLELVWETSNCSRYSCLTSRYRNSGTVIPNKPTDFVSLKLSWNFVLRMLSRSCLLILLSFNKMMAMISILNPWPMSSLTGLGRVAPVFISDEEDEDDSLRSANDEIARDCVWKYLYISSFKVEDNLLTRIVDLIPGSRCFLNWTPWPFSSSISMILATSPLFKTWCLCSNGRRALTNALTSFSTRCSRIDSLDVRSSRELGIWVGESDSNSDPESSDTSSVPAVCTRRDLRTGSS
ncbi:hypothetical protein OGAPHI_005911 [Ogataea philodendri]|uniref:Uncharacterized protein n=1 Tax=Ogataea philodendri TaxID=1378263 RepID=A0A9P8NWT9_9ASCO|nr:uncharacterized protein OGAPHI_005911 [Ogataea philodendri]KAH3661733.1 hypothetical protein OGAPHI_005911 [Ogataea philodendri]